MSMYKTNEESRPKVATHLPVVQADIVACIDIGIAQGAGDDGVDSRRVFSVALSAELSLRQHCVHRGQFMHWKGRVIQR